jgi:glycosyltransferase involved in cell wall biosynthesis
VRILSLADIRFPLERANGIQTMATAHALADRGHAVVLGVRPDVRHPARDPFDFYGLERPPSLDIIRAPCAGPYWLRRIQYLAWAAHVAFWRPFDVVFTRDLGVASVLVRLPRFLRPMVVYESHGYAPVFAGTLPDLVSGARPASDAKLRRLERREHVVWHRADGYVATTQVLVDDLTARFGAREAVAVTANGVRLTPERAFPAAPASRPPVVAYAGHLYPWKGVDVLVETLAKRSDMKGLILGGSPGDPDIERLRALADRLGVASRVEFAGLLPASDVPARLAQATVLVLPTTATPSARYSCPLKMFEYMAAGRTIVASDLPAVREVLTADVNAVLVPPEDSEALGSALQRVIDGPQFAERLARQAFDDVAGYSWVRRAERLEALFAHVKERRKA